MTCNTYEQRLAVISNMLKFKDRLNDEYIRELEAERKIILNDLRNKECLPDNLF